MNNPSPTQEDDRLAQLAEGQLKNELSADEKAELAELLDSSEEAQRRFVELVAFETALAEAHAAPVPAFSVETHEGSQQTMTVAKFVPWIAVAVCVVFLFWPRGEQQKPSTKGKPSALAMLVNRVDATFVAQRDAGDVRFDRGVHELTEGTIHLRFANGAEMVIESPARFELIDELHTRLEFGNIRAIVPPAAKGFTVATQTANFEDVGTEFGLRVERETGRESLLVFDGQVNVRSRDSNDLVESVEGGQAFQYQDGKPKEPADIRPETFPAPGAIGYRHWRSKTKARLRDRTLLALFTFEQDPDQPALLRNLQTEGASHVSDAQIHGARWGSGRWQGKDALTFEGQEQYAELEIEGEFEELTIAAWVRINRLDHPLNAVFNSNGWERGDLHLQFNRSGQSYTDLFESRLPKTNRWGVAASTADWMHVAATFSLIEKQTRVYVNGQLAYSCDLQPAGPIRPGMCRIGNWQAIGTFAPIRSFNGRIDELAIWNRSMNKAEIEAEMRRGQPSLLWARPNPTSP